MARRSNDTEAPGRHDGTDGSRRGGRSVLHWVLVLMVVGGLGASAVVLAGRGGATEAPKDTAPVAETITVARTDLTESQTLGGTLGFGTEQVVKGTGTGVVTKLPEVGSSVARGRPLYWVNDQPVLVLFGDTPFFRALDKPGIQGSDVKILLDNLKALGYSTGSQPKPPKEPRKYAPPQATLTPALAAALKKWQQESGLAPTGTLALGQVVVLPGSVRVSALRAHPGADVATELLTVTSTAKSVTVPVAATEVGTISVGADVTVTLPDGTEIPAKVSSISHIVQDGGAGAPLGQSGPPKVDVTVTPTKAADVAKLDAAAVQVRFTTTVHKGVLAVPVGALVALREGGYALQHPDGTLTAVETGMFAKGLVEISGPAVAEGLEVVTSS
ncbi:efflux RND transporter periplasmic adaptor subunit [Micromonospora sp. NPDC050417]|uniref:efflux RND transporter periplasmic adaptor subunit n=1 Tax=Micromonospora sp. NPDC050417 TaxID=3364280 RepID=UPI00379BF0A7